MSLVESFIIAAAREAYARTTAPQRHSWNHADAIACVLAEASGRFGRGMGWR